MKCKGCGDSIKWVKMETGGNMPVDEKPIRMIGIRKIDRTIKAEIGYMVDAYMPHWATCIKADQFKRKRG